MNNVFFLPTLKLQLPIVFKKVRIFLENIFRWLSGHSKYTNVYNCINAVLFFNCRCQGNPRIGLISRGNSAYLLG